LASSIVPLAFELFSCFKHKTAAAKA